MGPRMREDGRGRGDNHGAGFAGEQRGWVPACARTDEGGEIIMGQVLRGNNGDGSPHSRGQGREGRYKSLRGKMGPRIREDKGGEIVTGQVLRGNNGDGSPHLRGQGGRGDNQEAGSVREQRGWVPASARTRREGR